MSEAAVVTTILGAVGGIDGTSAVPALYAPDASVARRAFEFFAVNIRNQNTRKAYARAASEFATWCSSRGLNDVRHVQPVHVVAYIESLMLKP